jgi:hypothetical protein
MIGLIEEHVGSELKSLVSITAPKETKKSQFRLLSSPAKSEELDEEAEVQEEKLESKVVRLVLDKCIEALGICI